MKAYSMDLRERVVAACDAREGTREQIAERFGVSDRWIRKVLQRRRETGSIAPLPRNPGRKRALNDRQTERLRRLIQKRPDATLQELRKSLGVKISIAGAVDLIGAVIDINFGCIGYLGASDFGTQGCTETTAMSGWNQAPLPRDQILLFPETLGDCIPQNHSVRLFAEILDGLDWSSWEQHYILVAGQPPIHPKITAGVICMVLPTA